MRKHKSKLGRIYYSLGLLVVLGVVYYAIGRVTMDGQQAPSFQLTTPEGEAIKLSDFEGKYLLIDFWASWCPPCRKANPKVVALHQKYASKNLAFLSISLDTDEDAWKAAIVSDGLVWQHGSNLSKWDCEVRKAYGVGSIPHLVLISPEGMIVKDQIDPNELEAVLAKYVKK